ncbi:MAG: hypothetical protein E7260_07385 [Lachnospiraceae bacterium]|nr:hypothetical protein [Lachnospiraceae bacterium]
MIFLTNSHGDVISLTDNNGTLTETYTYDAFGTLTYFCCERGAFLCE